MPTPTRCFIIIARLYYTICDPRVLVLLYSLFYDIQLLKTLPTFCGLL